MLSADLTSCFPIVSLAKVSHPLTALHISSAKFSAALKTRKSSNFKKCMLLHTAEIFAGGFSVFPLTPNAKPLIPNTKHKKIDTYDKTPNTTN